MAPNRGSVLNPDSRSGKLVSTTTVCYTEADLQSLRCSDAELDQRLRQIEISKISYLSEGLRIGAYLLRPHTANSLPCLIYNRGGTGNFHPLTEKILLGRLSRIAAHGYIVIASQYRGGPDSEGNDEFGGADVNDVLNLIPLIDHLPFADSSRIGMFGWSRGGMMAYRALTRTDRINAAVIAAGVADMFDTIERRPEIEQKVFAELLPDWPASRNAVLEARSALRWPQRLHKQTPLLLLHGSADWRVEPMQSLQMAMALHKARHPYRLVMLEGGDHALTEHKEEVDRLILDWLDTYVRDRKPWPSLDPHGV